MDKTDIKSKYGFKVRGREYLVEAREESLINPRVSFDLFSCVVNDLLREIDKLKERVIDLEASHIDIIPQSRTKDE